MSSGPCAVCEQQQCPKRAPRHSCLIPQSYIRQHGQFQLLSLLAPGWFPAPCSPPGTSSSNTAGPAPTTPKKALKKPQNASLAAHTCSGTGAAGPTRGLDHGGCFAARLFFSFFLYFLGLGEQPRNTQAGFTLPSSSSTFKKLVFKATLISAQTPPRSTAGPGYPTPQKRKSNPQDLGAFSPLCSPLSACRRRCCKHADRCAAASSRLGFSQAQGGH